MFYFLCVSCLSKILVCKIECSNRLKKIFQPTSAEQREARKKCHKSATFATSDTNIHALRISCLVFIFFFN